MPVSYDVYEVSQTCLSSAGAILNDIESVLQDDPAMAGRHGCVLCIAYYSGDPFLLAEIGQCTPEKRQMYFKFAQGDAIRLSVLAEHAGHTLSRESANEALERWAGAVRGQRFIYSVAGFPADVDEMFSLALVVRAEKITGGTAVDLCMRSNAYFDKLKYLLDLK